MIQDVFRKIAYRCAELVGTPWAFFLAVIVIVVWILTGKLFDYSDTWQLVINTGTTIVTFLMVFLLQNTQNHDSRAIHLKLDELIHSVKSARNKMIDLEDMSDEDLNKLQEEFEKMGKGLRKKNPEL